MTERDLLIQSIADTIKDYRAGELIQPSPDHINKWVMQFEDGVQVPILHEMDHILKYSYYTKERIKQFLNKLVSETDLVGTDPCGYWKNANFICNQQKGHSQEQLLEIFDEILISNCHLSHHECGSDEGEYLYIDDGIFSGRRAGTDLSAWIVNDAPKTAKLNVIVIVAHTLGEWQFTKQLEKIAKDSGKQISTTVWAELRLENTKANRFTAEVLWPTIIPEDAAIESYIAEETKYPFICRKAGGRIKHPVFSSEARRQLIELELLKAGMRIRSFSHDPHYALRPLGFSAFGLGFGSTIVTYRNCPNNAPLALWWGNPNAPSSHPFSKWHPLFPRKTYSEESEYLDFSGYF